MSHRKIKRILALLCVCATLFASPLASFAEEEPSGDDVVIKEEDKPYLALGADLTADQQHTVLSLMGIDAADLENYDVVYVNNSEEHEYLDSYISSSAIGTHALSSVLIAKTEEGSGIHISTYNINYCTSGMYKNAMATAGITDADVIVAGPTSISGTAALVGIFKAYSEMTGEALDQDAVDAAMDELVTTGSIEASGSVDSEKLEAMIAELKEMIANGSLDSEDEIRDAIEEAAEKYGLKLSSEDIDKLLALLQKIKGLDIDWNGILNQASDWASKYGSKLKDMVTSEGFWDKVIAFFRKIIAKIKELF